MPAPPVCPGQNFGTIAATGFSEQGEILLEQVRRGRLGKRRRSILQEKWNLAGKKRQRFSERLIIWSDGRLEMRASLEIPAATE